MGMAILGTNWWRHCENMISHYIPGGDGKRKKEKKKKKKRIEKRRDKTRKKKRKEKKRKFTPPFELEPTLTTCYGGSLYARVPGPTLMVHLRSGCSETRGNAMNLPVTSERHEYFHVRTTWKSSHKYKYTAENEGRVNVAPQAGYHTRSNNTQKQTQQNGTER